MSELKPVTMPSNLEDEVMRNDLDKLLSNKGYMGTVKSILLRVFFDREYYRFSSIQEYVQYALESGRDNNYILPKIRYDKKLWDDLIKLAQKGPRDCTVEEKVIRNIREMAWKHAYSGATTTAVPGWAESYTGPNGNAIGIAWTISWANAYNSDIIKRFKAEEESRKRDNSSASYGGYF